jgi:DSF synthase
MEPLVSLASGQVRTYTQISTRYDHAYKTEWYWMYGSPRPCFTPTMLAELVNYLSTISTQQDRMIHFVVQASSFPGIHSLGGDLHLFRELIVKRDRAALLSYAEACIMVLDYLCSGVKRGISTIALVCGDALGGGFESALACDVLIAEKGAKMGLPEILFNLFPGMGAYSFLSRKVGNIQAEKMILSGNLYSAEALHALGVVDLLAENGEGEAMVYEYIRKESRFRNGYSSVRGIRKMLDPVTYEELMKVTERWVDAALCLEDRNLRMMEKLISRQNSRAKSEFI